MKRIILRLWLPIFLALFTPAAAQCSDEKANMNSKIPSMTIEEIATLDSVSEIKAFAKKRGLPLNIKSVDEMKAQRDYNYEVAKTLAGAKGRLSITFWIRKEEDTVHVSFFFDSDERVIGRQIMIEANNMP